MTPREVIADAVSRSFYGQLLMKQSEYRQGICRDMAAAVIDALEGMEVTDKMSRACWENMDGTSWNIWRALVGAMRDEL